MTHELPTNDARFTISEIAAATGGIVVRDGPPVRGVAVDPRALRPGAAFLPLNATPYDLARRVAEASLAGAGAFVMERALSCPPGRGIVLVRSVADALGGLARAHRRRWAASPHPVGRRTVVCITGSSGKSTTRRLVRSLLDVVDRGATLCTGASTPDRTAIALHLLALDDRHRFAVLETATRERGDVARIAAIAEPDVAAVTLVSMAHAEGVGGLDDVAREKGDLLASVPDGGLVGVNGDDGRALGQLSRARATRRITWGFDRSADYRVEAREQLGIDGCRVRIARPTGPTLEVTTTAFGAAGALAIAAALAIVEQSTNLVVDPTALASAVRIADAEDDPRLMPTPLPDGTLVLEDSSDATPASMGAALEAGRELATALGRRLVFVLGDMRELGGASAAEHARVGALVASTAPAAFVTVGRDARNAAVETLSRGIDTWAFADTSTAVRRVLGIVAAGDVVVIAGGPGSEVSAIARAIVADRIDDRPARVASLAHRDEAARGTRAGADIPSRGRP